MVTETKDLPHGCPKCDNGFGPREMHFRNLAESMVSEIKNAKFDPNECAYIDADGEWSYGLDGCQPNYTMCVSREDFEQCCESEIIDNVQEWLENL